MRGIAVVIAAARRRLRHAAGPGVVDPRDRSGRVLLRLAGRAAATTAAGVTLAMTFTLTAAAA
jgi:hypothetical protein